MAAILKLEAIGDNWRFCAKMLRANRVHSPGWRDELNSIRYGQKRHGPWVARITENGRKFLHGPRDYAQANKTGERGIFEYYYLDDGIYEVNEPTGLGRARHYFLLVRSDTQVEISQQQAIEEITREELPQCQNEHWD